MVVDTSALLAILFGEPQAPTVEQAFEADARRLLSAASLVEAGIVVEARLGGSGGRELDLLLVTADVIVAPVGREEAAAARRAFRTFGKGRHPAGLNYGDCFTYAMAALTGEPVLATGREFSLTDVPVVDLGRFPP